MFPILAVAALQSSLDSILDSPKLHGALVSACVCRLDGSVLYERNADARAMPASNQKLFTAAFALSTLGPEFKPRTRFWAEEKGIVVDAPGDPSITVGQLKSAAAKLGPPASGTVFVRQAYRTDIPPTWEFDDLAHRYAARVTSLTMNGGAFQLFAEKGAPIIEPPGLGIRIMHFPWGTRGNRFEPFGNLLVVHGELPLERTLLESFAIPEPDRAAARAVGGRLMATDSVPNRDADYVIEGKSVGELVQACLPPSDNFIAEHLFMMAAAKTGPLGDDPYATAAPRFAAFLNKTVGIPEGAVRPVDGSGMSRHNMAGSRAIASLLVWARKQSWAEIWEKSLAVPGIGTLATRLKGVDFKGKTGTLDMASSLSGYLRSPAGQTLVVSVILNNYSCSSVEARQVLDAFVSELARSEARGTDVVGTLNHESRLSQPRHSPAHGYRIPGPGAYRNSLPARPHRRNEPSDASAAGAKRVAFRAG